jgi:hypothetical protein
MDKHKLSKSKVTGKAKKDDADQILSVIVHVREANYVPEWLTIRKIITTHIFTADIQKEDLPKLENDDQVVSVSINEPLNLL